jgi:hypothetical protein
MHPRPGSSAPPTGQSCPIDRAALHKADTVRGPPAWSLSAGLSTCARSRGHTRPLSGTHPPAQRDTPAHSTGHTCPLDGTHPPTRRDTPARSTGHTRPLGGTHVPARRDTPARWAGHACPLGGAYLPTRRVSGGYWRRGGDSAPQPARSDDRPPHRPAYGGLAPDDPHVLLGTRDGRVEELPRQQG